MDKNRLTKLFGSSQTSFKVIQVMSVQRAYELKTQILKHSAVDKNILKSVLRASDSVLYGLTHKRCRIKNTLNTAFGFSVGIFCSHCGEILCHSADVFGNGHLIVVQYYNNVSLALACIVKTLIKLTAC